MIKNIFLKMVFLQIKISLFGKIVFVGTVEFDQHVL